MKITAVISVRNEIQYVIRLMEYLSWERIDCVFIDNDSSDGTRQYLSDVGAAYQTLPYRGSFDLSEQLRVKADLIQELETDWVIHHDADEIMHGPKGIGGLRLAIEQAEKGGFNCLNFNELVFLPSHPNTSYSSHLMNENYYYFEPCPQRLMRAYRKDSGLCNLSSGGHYLEGEREVSVYPEPMLLRHYITLSQDHANRKYIGRNFSEEDERKGWHYNRLVINSENIKIPMDHSNLSRLRLPFDLGEVLKNPIKQHFWEWDQTKGSYYT